MKGIKAFLAKQEDKRISEPFQMPNPVKIKESGRSPLLQTTQSDNRTRTGSNIRLMEQKK
jgi:hypothetical protein